MPKIPTSETHYPTRHRACGIKDTKGVLLPPHAEDEEKTIEKIFQKWGNICV
jgi:hypothetical protein